MSPCGPVCHQVGIPGVGVELVEPHRDDPALVVADESGMLDLSRNKLGRLARLAAPLALATPGTVAIVGQTYPK